MVQFRMVRKGSVSAILAVGALFGCTNSSPTTVMPGKVGKAGAIGADGKPCTKSAGIRLDGGGELNLTAPENPNGAQQTIRPVTVVRNIENGGWLDVGFWGIPVAKFGVPGNPLGYVEVLNIPYCTQTASLKSEADLWINRCLNHEWKERFKSDVSDKNEFISQFRRPAEVQKRCTAQFTIDPTDLKAENGKYRVRVWTAEHCYQPAYSTSVTLQIYHQQENGGVYVPLLMNLPDGKVWRDKVLAVGGGGGAMNDPKLADKILILRSTDGRSSDVFRDTYNKYCRQHESTGSFPRFDNGASPKNVDCFSMTDVATFKGTILPEQPVRKVTQKKEQIKPEQVTFLRKSALENLVKKSLESRSNPVDNLFASKFPEKLREQISINKFTLSVFDGMQHARRVRAFKEELNALGKDNPEQADNQLRPFAELFSMRTVDVSNDKIESLVLELLDELFSFIQKQALSSLPSQLSFVTQPPVQAGLNLVCSKFNVDCERRHYSPLDTLALEDVALGRSSGGFIEFIMQRINVMIAVFANNTFLEKNHPLRVLPADSQFMANAKYLGLQIKYWLDVMLLHNNPAAGNTFVAPLAKTMQEMLEETCGAQSFGALMFPVMGNIQKPTGVTTFEAIVPVKVGTKLSVIPIGVTKPEDYRPSKCWENTKQNLVVLTANGSPERTIFGVHVNDKALVPPSEAEVNANSKVIEQRLIDYVSSRVVFKYAGANGDSFSVGEDGGDSGTMLSFMGLPSFVLSTHNKNPVNGVVLAELPEPNIPEADFEAGGKSPAGNCVPSGSSK